MINPSFCPRSCPDLTRTRGSRSQSDPAGRALGRRRKGSKVKGCKCEEGKRETGKGNKRDRGAAGGKQMGRHDWAHLFLDVPIKLGLPANSLLASFPPRHHTAPISLLISESSAASPTRQRLIFTLHHNSLPTESPLFFESNLTSSTFFFGCHLPCPRMTRTRKRWLMQGTGDRSVPPNHHTPQITFPVATIYPAFAYSWESC